MVARRRTYGSRRGRGAALAFVLALLAQVVLAPPASAGALDRTGGPSVGCACPEDGRVVPDRDAASVPDAPLDPDACERCDCCAGPGGSAWITADSPAIQLGCHAHPVTDRIAPSTVDPPRIPKPPERPSR